MKWFRQVVLVVAAVAVAAPAVQAQRGQGIGFANSPVSLLGQKSVQEELKLSEEQKDKAKSVVEKRRSAMQEMRNLSREDRQKKVVEQNKADDKAIAEILKPEQLTRLKQISLQQRGAQAFADAEVADALKLTSEQKDKIKALQDEARTQMRGLRQAGNREEARKKIEEIRKASAEKLNAVLTPEQQTKWKELTGEPFKGELTRPGPRRPGSGNRRPPAG
jgi:Spy/CpxP family protein refolding chaperone